MGIETIVKIKIRIRHMTKRFKFYTFGIITFITLALILLQIHLIKKDDNELNTTQTEYDEAGGTKPNMETEEDTPLTIEEYLSFRKEMQLARYYDSVFLKMPDASLIAILTKIGTDANIEEIAKEYIQNRAMYD